MQNKTKILFIGDIVGRPGREAVQNYLVDNNKKQEYDFIIANIENASHGFGLTKKNHDELISYGINCMTSGNHIWDKKDILTYIDESEVLIRPNNYHKSAQGVGYRIFEDKNIIVLNFLGRTFMPPIDCPFVSLECAMGEINKITNTKDKIILIDFHAEASAEKQCFAKYAFDKYSISAFVGTHTHVQTADERVINGCAYITDVGYCGSKNSVIGMEFESSYKRLLTSINERFDVETTPPYVLNACEIIFEGNIAQSIKRITFEYNKEDVSNEEN